MRLLAKELGPRRHGRVYGPGPTRTNATGNTTLVGGAHLLHSTHYPPPIGISNSNSNSFAVRHAEAIMTPGSGRTAPICVSSSIAARIASAKSALTTGRAEKLLLAVAIAADAETCSPR